jgi:hypothetical protein
MKSRSRKAIIVVAAIAGMALGQHGPSLARQAAAGEEGFFRPARDPALTSVPPSSVPATSRAQAEGGPPRDEAEAAREAAERELDRSRREHLQAQSTAQTARPLIVSPLDGTAPITSPLDGTAPIASPIGR